MNPPTVLVTGGNGFLGRAVVERCLARGYAVRVYGRSDLSADLAPRVTFHRGNLADATALTAAVQGCDYVFHVAAKAGVWGLGTTTSAVISRAPRQSCRPAASTA